MLNAQNEKIFIVTGIKIGRLTIGDLVSWVKDHPAYETTPISYLRQGRLRECKCDCGEIRLVSETHLATGRIKSCGCLKRERKDLGLRQKISKYELKMQSDRLTAQLRMEQARLKHEQMSMFKDEKKIADIATRIRDIIHQKMSLTNYKRRAQQRNRYREQKLLEEAQSLINNHHVTEEQPK